MRLLTLIILIALCSISAAQEPAYFGFDFADSAKAKEVLNDKAKNFPRTKGVVVTSVEIRSPSAEQLHMLDIITHVNNQAVSGIDEFKSNLSKTNPGEVTTLRIMKFKQVGEKMSWERAAVKITPVTKKAFLESVMHVEKDEISGLKKIRHVDAPSSAIALSNLCLEIRESDGQMKMFLRVTYNADTWIFMKSMILSRQNARFEHSFGLQDVQRDNERSIWEWSYIPVTKELREIFEGDSKEECTLRITGSQYYKDRVISESEKRMISQTLEYYELFKK